MIGKIIEFSVHNKFLVGFLTAALVIAGLWSMKQVPIDAVPDITNNQVQVITVAPNLGTEDIEQFVTYPVEISMSNLPNVMEIRSISRSGLSVVTIVFEDNVGTYLPRQLVSEKLKEVSEQIPEGFGSPFMGPISTGLGEIYQYTLEVDSAYEGQYSLMDLRTIQDWVVKRQLSMLSGVVEVNSMGGEIKQYEVAIDPAALRAINLTIADVFRALQENNQNTGGAYIEKNHQANFIRGDGLIRSLSDIENIVIKTLNDVPITIKDVAKVHYGNAVRYGAFTKNGDGEAVGGMIMMLKGSNSNEVIQDVKERISQIEKTLPEGVHIVPFLDRSKLISQTTSTVTQNLMEGGLIVIFILVLLLGNWRGGVIVASTIPLSLLFAFICMNIFDVWANLMSLGAIDFGIIVDGAVIIVESVVFTLHKYMQRSKAVGSDIRNKTAIDSSKRMMNSAFFGQLIILIVFLPILALEGVEGKMFKPMALTFIFAMLGAMILCLTYVPMLSSVFIRTRKAKKISLGDRFVSSIENKYESLLRLSLRKPWAVVSTSIVLLLLASFTFTRMGGEFIPQLDEGDIAFHAFLKPGSALSEMVEATTKIEEIVMDNFPEVEQVLSRIGVADVPTDPMPMDIADVFVILKPRSDWVSAKTKDELIDKMKRKVSSVLGVNYEFTQPVEMRFNELLTGVREEVAIKIFGDDLEVLAEKSQEVGNLIANIRGVADMRVEATNGLPQILVKYNRAKIAQYGTNINYLNMVLQSAFAGKMAGTIYEGERRFDLVVRLDEGYRQNIEHLRNLYINLPNGSQIPIKEVAEINYDTAPMQISRDDTHRRAYVGINVRDRDIKSLVSEIRSVLDERLELPTGYYIVYGGAFQNLERATRRLEVVVPLALLLVFILIFFALRSFKRTMIIYMAIPFATIGGVFSLWLRDMPFSISAGVGFIVLFGVAVLNGLVLMNSLGKRPTGVDLKTHIIGGTRRRIRPILLTASTDVLGFLPMAISTSAGAEVQRPLATVVIGGLITASFLTLFVLPVLYQWAERRSGKKIGLKFSTMLSKRTALFVVVLLCLLGQSQSVYSQVVPTTSTISFEEAITKAKADYPSIKASYLEYERQQKLKKTAFDLGETQIYTASDEVGGNDAIHTIVGVQQELDVLSISSKTKLQDERVKMSELNLQLKEKELEAEVGIAWVRCYIAQQRWQLAQSMDSVYVDFMNGVKLRYETQASSRLELLAAINQYKQMEVMKTQAYRDYLIAIQRLNRYLYTDTLYSSDLEFPASLVLSLSSSIFRSDHPQLQLAEQEIAIAKAEQKVVQSVLLPKLNIQAGLQEKNGSNDKLYNYQIGVSLPLWFRPYKGRVEAAKIQAYIAEQRAEERRLQSLADFNATCQSFIKWEEVCQFYQDEALPLAKEQRKASLTAYKEGAINYLSFIQNTKDALTIEINYLEALENYLSEACSLNFWL